LRYLRGKRHPFGCGRPFCACQGAKVKRGQAAGAVASKPAKLPQAAILEFEPQRKLDLPLVVR
jgi:hypothetical protein